MNFKIKISSTIALLLVVNIALADAWEQKSNFGGTGRHRANGFSIQDKGYIGFGHINSVTNIAYEDIWEYDPASDTWTQKANFGGGLRYHVAVFSIGNKAYCGTGRNASFLYYQDFWEFDPVTNIWTQISDFPDTGRYGAVGFALNGAGYVGSGTVSSSGSNNFYKYEPSTDTWTPVATFPGNVRGTGVSFTINNKGYLGTASGAFGAGKDFWEYKPDVDQWVQRADVGPTPRAAAGGFSINGKGYILTGTNWGTGDNYNDVWEFNPMDNTWIQINDFPGAKRRFPVCFTIGDVAYLGTGTSGINFNDFWRFDGSTVGVGERELATVSVFPNPATDIIHFEFDQKSSDSYVVIYDVFGRKVKSVELGNSNSVSCTEMTKGTYVYQLFSGQKKIANGKFMVVK